MYLQSLQEPKKCFLILSSQISFNYILKSTLLFFFCSYCLYLKNMFTKKNIDSQKYQLKAAKFKIYLVALRIIFLGPKICVSDADIVIL